MLAMFQHNYRFRNREVMCMIWIQVIFNTLNAKATINWTDDLASTIPRIGVIKATEWFLQNSPSTFDSFLEARLYMRLMHHPFSIKRRVSWGGAYWKCSWFCTLIWLPLRHLLPFLALSPNATALSGFWPSQTFIGYKKTVLRALQEPVSIGRLVVKCWLIQVSLFVA